MKRAGLTIICVLWMSVLLPDHLSGQQGALFNKKMSEETRHFLDSLWKADSLESRHFLDAYAESCSRIGPDTSLTEAKHCDMENLYRRYAKDGFAACAGELYFYYQDLTQRMSAEDRQTAIAAMENAARQYKSKTLALEAGWMKILLLPEDTKEQITNKLKLLNEFTAERVSGKETHFRLRAMRKQLNLHREIFFNFSTGHLRKPFSMDYSLEIIRQAVVLSHELEKVTIETYPFVNSDYVAIGEIFYYFNDSTRLASTLGKVLAQPVTAFPDPSRLQAGIMMGRYMNARDYEQQAKEFFLGVFECEDKTADRRLYNVMALANWGICIAEDTSEDAVLPLLEPVLQPLKEAGKYKLIEEVYRALSLIYIKKDNREKVIEMNDSLYYYYLKTEMDDDPLFAYDIEKYKLRYRKYTKGTISYSYAGMALLSLEAQHRLYHPINITNAVAEVYEKDAALKAMELASLRNRQYTILIITILSLSAFFVIFRLYRKKQNAYRILAERAAQWANTETLEVITPDTASGSQQPCEEAKNGAAERIPEDKRLMNRVHEVITKDRLYKDHSLSLHTLADQTHINHHALSRAINSITGKNFNQFINEYRIKEAIRIMTSAPHKNIYIDELYEQVGFSSRTSFYRVFKQTTGLSPTEYKKTR